MAGYWGVGPGPGVSMVQMKAAELGTGKNPELMEARALVCSGV